MARIASRTVTAAAILILAACSDTSGPSEIGLTILSGASLTDAEDDEVATWEPAAAGAFSGRVQAGAVAAQTMFTFQWIHGTPTSGHAEGEFDIRVTVSP